MPRVDPRPVAALAIDVGAVTLFAALGRRNHAEGITATGIATTAWPFVAGVVTGWVLSRGWRRPTALLPTGLAVWVCAVALGMLLRKISGAGTAWSFVVVATVATGVLLLGWRAAAGVVSRRLGRSGP